MKISELDDKKLLERVLKDFSDSESFHQEQQVKWKEYYKMYRSRHEDSEIRKNRSSLFIPYVFAIIETITPRAVKAVIANKPFLAVQPNEQYQAGKAKAIEALIQHQLETRINFVRIITDWLKDVLIYGTGVVRTSWKNQNSSKETQTNATLL